MAKWTLRKNETKSHDGGVETVTYEATIDLVGDDPDHPITLADLATMIGDLHDNDGLPMAAVLGANLQVPLRWTSNDL